MFSKEKKRSSKIFFQAISKKKVFKKVFSGEKGLQKFFSDDLCLRKPKKKVFADFSARFLAFFQRNFNGSKIVLFSSRGQGNFRGLEASRPRPRTSKTCPSRPRDVLEGLHLCFLNDLANKEGFSVLAACSILHNAQCNYYNVIMEHDA